MKLRIGDWSHSTREIVMKTEGQRRAEEICKIVEKKRLKLPKGGSSTAPPLNLVKVRIGDWEGSTPGLKTQASPRYQDGEVVSVLQEWIVLGPLGRSPQPGETIELRINNEIIRKIVVKEVLEVRVRGE